MARQGILVEPYKRLNEAQIEQIHRLSMEILSDTGIICFNKNAAEIFGDGGAGVTAIEDGRQRYWKLVIPEKLVLDAVESAPGTVKLGARNEDNALILDGHEPRVRFASGSESNNWLEMDIEVFVSEKEPSNKTNRPVFHTEKGSTSRLAAAAHLCENMESWDAFLRPVNIQDEEINDDNKDVNKIFASLNNTSKHVMAGLTSLEQLDNLIKMGQIIAGGEENFRNNPIFSLITSLIKSPLQLVDDTSQKAIEIARRGVPLVISSAPQGGSTAPIIEAGIVAQINAEILTGIALAQLSAKGAPVIYGSVPGRANMEDLSDSYGIPEFSQYNIDCVQMARYYGVPCYSSAGVSDAAIPGIQASVERLFSQTMMALAGPQYLHYSFGLMERTNTFCPVQAVLDNAHIGFIKNLAAQPVFDENTVPEILAQTRKTMASSTKLFTRFARSALRSGGISPGYRFKSRNNPDETLFRAQEKLEEIMALPPNHIENQVVEKVFREIPGLLSKLKSN
jgi:trimethylamine--corrinoid protein Co-methyltransferase